MYKYLDGKHIFPFLFILCLCEKQIIHAFAWCCTLCMKMQTTQGHKEHAGEAKCSCPCLLSPPA